MKKTVKRTVLLLVLFSLAVSLCGCNALDELRERQAYWGENDAIVWKDTVYKKLPNEGTLYVDIDQEEAALNVTEPDVPVLLSVFCTYAHVCENDIFLCSGGDYYCREDQYQEIWNRIYSPFQADLICYSYTVYDMETYSSETKYYTLTKDQVDMLGLVVEKEEPKVLGDGWSLRTDVRLSLWECSEDMLFRRDTMDLARSGDTYYLYLYTGKETCVFTIPSGCNDTCKEIFKAYDNRNNVEKEENAESV